MKLLLLLMINPLSLRFLLLLMINPLSLRFYYPLLVQLGCLQYSSQDFKTSS
jgi:hypothetical protein